VILSHILYKMVISPNRGAILKMDMITNDNIVKRQVYRSYISAVKERMSTLQKQTRDFEAWRKSLSEEAVPHETLKFMISCTTHGDAIMHLLLTTLGRVEEKIADDTGPIPDDVVNEGSCEIEKIHFAISRQQEKLHVASLLFLFPGRDTDLNNHDALIVAARTADFLISYSLHKVQTFKITLEAHQVAIQDTHSSILQHFQSSDSDVSATWLRAKIKFLDKYTTQCSDHARKILLLYSKFSFNPAGHRIITANDWKTIQNDTLQAQIDVIMWQHLFTIFFTNASEGYQNAIETLDSM